MSFLPLTQAEHKLQAPQPEPPEWAPRDTDLADLDPKVRLPSYQPSSGCSSLCKTSAPLQLPSPVLRDSDVAVQATLLLYWTADSEEPLRVTEAQMRAMTWTQLQQIDSHYLASAPQLLAEARGDLASPAGQRLQVLLLLTP